MYEAKMNKDRLDLLKETEGYIPPVFPLTSEERKNFYLRLSAVMNISGEQFLSGKLFQILLYQKDILPVMYLNENTENTALKIFLQEYNLHDEFVYLHSAWDTEDIDKIATSELADNFPYYWYPSADDLLIISPSFEWIIGVRHDGAMYFQKYYSRQTTLGADNE